MISVAPIIKNSRHVCHRVPKSATTASLLGPYGSDMLMSGARHVLSCVGHDRLSPVAWPQGAPPVQSHFNTIPREVPSWVNHSVSLFCTEPSNGFHQSWNESQSPSQSGHQSVPQHHLLLLFPSPPSVPSTPGSLLFLARTRPIPNSEPLCLLFLLPGDLFLQTAAWLPTSLSSVLCSNSTFPGSPFGTSLFTLSSPPTQVHTMQS